MLEQDIRTFKAEGYALLGSFQNSGMCTVKWHVFDHVCDDIRRLGSLSAGSADLYEYSHILFKREYRKTSM